VGWHSVTQLWVRCTSLFEFRLINLSHLQGRMQFMSQFFSFPRISLYRRFEATCHMFSALTALPGHAKPRYGTVVMEKLLSSCLVSLCFELTSFVMQPVKKLDARTKYSDIGTLMCRIVCSVMRNHHNFTITKIARY
jgi:hypothetical protein